VRGFPPASARGYVAFLGLALNALFLRINQTATRQSAAKIWATIMTTVHAALTVYTISKLYFGCVPHRIDQPNAVSSFAGERVPERKAKRFAVDVGFGLLVRVLYCNAPARPAAVPHARQRCFGLNGVDIGYFITAQPSSSV
jgi:hypothetical protein